MGSNRNMTDRKHALVSRHGTWNAALEYLAAVAPDFFDAYVDLLAASTANGCLPPKTRAVIMIALTSTMTNLSAAALQEHIRQALAAGVERDEIVEVFQLVSALGLHSCTFGVPILVEELQQHDGADAPGWAGDPERQEMKDKFIRLRGYWSDFWDNVLALSPRFFAAYLRFSTLPWVAGRLEPKVKELIYIAIDSNTTHLYEQGLRIHVRNALRHGATGPEIMEVLQLAATLGIRTFEVGMPLLSEEMRLAGKTP